MQEVWKGIAGYEENYQVSNLGNVRSLNYQGHGYVRNLVPKVNNRGRLWVELRKGERIRQMLIHRLVAEAFIPNPNEFPQINHKDENPKNNNVCNLEWCTCSYNVKYSCDRHPERAKNRKSSPTRRRMLQKNVVQTDLDGNVIKVWEDCRTICTEKHYNQWSISQCCDGKRNTAYGFRWHYAI